MARASSFIASSAMEAIVCCERKKAETKFECDSTRTGLLTLIDTIRWPPSAAPGNRVSLPAYRAMSIWRPPVVVTSQQSRSLFGKIKNWLARSPTTLNPTLMNLIGNRYWRGLQSALAPHDIGLLNGTGLVVASLISMDHVALRTSITLWCYTH